MRATYFAFESSTLAQQGNKEASSRFLNLNGTWKFHWVNHYDKLPSNFEKTDFNDRSWDNFSVPANWEFNGYGTPIYVNHPFEFALKILLLLSFLVDRTNRQGYTEKLLNFLLSGMGNKYFYILVL